MKNSSPGELGSPKKLLVTVLIYCASLLVRWAKTLGWEDPTSKRVATAVRPEHRSMKSPATSTKSSRLYREKEFDCQAIREDVLAIIGSRTSDEQKALVFTESGGCSVAAGAGSGKSTTLISRLLVMRWFLGVPLHEIAVFTFTRNSREDFIGKLLAASPKFGSDLSRDEAEARVKTFHAKVLQLTTSSLPPGVLMFEFLGKAKKPVPGTPEEKDFLEKQIRFADEQENPYDRELSGDQKSVLTAVYEASFQSDDRFRRAVGAMYSYARLAGQKFGRGKEKDDWEKREKAAARDAALTEYVQRAWEEQRAWPIDGVEPPPRKLAVGELKFSAHGYIRGFDTFIVLGGNMLPMENVRLNGVAFNPNWSCNSKRNVLLTGCNERLLFVDVPSDVSKIRAVVEDSRNFDAGKAPIFSLRFPGDGGKEKPIYQALYELMTFIENGGLRADRAVELLRSGELSSLERDVVFAVSVFAKHFADYCRTNNLSTFNDLFFRMSEGGEYLSKVSTGALASMRHLLVDEFQDISPLIVRFINGVHRELRRRGPTVKGPTILVVGDDWQSIYGWRGSAPHFFLKFSELFWGANPVPVELKANYRSSRRIVDCSKYLIEETEKKHRMEKHCYAGNGRVASLAVPMFLVEDADYERIQLIVKGLLSLCTGNEEVLVLARTGSSKRKAEEQCKGLGSGRLKIMTIHGSKGLEAEYVLVLDDVAYSLRNNIKNAVYHAAGFEQTFDNAQRDEAYRVAYVALTRAKKVGVWMGSPRDDGAMRAMPRDGALCLRVDVGQLIQRLSEAKDALGKVDRAPELV